MSEKSRPVHRGLLTYLDKCITIKFCAAKYLLPITIVVPTGTEQ